VAGLQHYPVLLAEGMLSRDLCIHAVVSTKGGSARKFLSKEEFQADQQGEKAPHLWRSVDLVKPADENKYLTLGAERARELGVAQDVVHGLNDLYELEGVSPGEVRLADSDWLDSLADFLRDPWTSVVLVMLGITCLILELKMPGVGLPGVVSAVCFVLFFWSHSQLNGQITWLAILLFVLGLLLIGLEVFVLPGFGVAGISGILLVLGSLGLVAYGHWPRSNEEWVSFGQKLSPFGISILGALAAAFLLARYLPSIPFANRLMLRPQEEAGEVDEPLDPAQAELHALLGAIGVAATPLRPAGKMQFGEQFIDVVAEGGYVLPGTRVQVIEIEGNRVVVKEV
jgi:membrane-bound serine protease (ClpP class)